MGKERNDLSISSLPLETGQKFETPDSWLYSGAANGGTGTGSYQREKCVGARGCTCRSSAAGLGRQGLIVTNLHRSFPSDP
jgi:hypothetical protein